MRKLVLILFVILISIPIFAQEMVKDYTWKKKPTFKVNMESAEDFSAIILLDHRIKEFYGGRSQQPLQMSNANHVAIKIMDKSAIEDYNRVYVPNYGKLTEIKARTIKPDGSIIELDEDKMKKIEDEQYGGYTIFALEGLDEGDIVEYMYKRNLRGDYCGIEIFQKDIPVQKAVFEIYSTRVYNIETKSYSGLDEFDYNEEIDELPKSVEPAENIISITENIPALPDEGSASSLNDYKMRAAYRIVSLESPSNRQEFDLLTWQKIAQNINDFGEVFKIKGYSKLFKELGLSASTPVDQKVIVLEKYFKESFTYKQDRSASADKFKNILKNNYGNDVDMTRAMKHLLKLLGVHSVWMISTDKNYIRVDPEFPNTTGLREHILYIPFTGKYVAMGYRGLRYGPPPTSMIDNHGLIVSDIGILDEIEYDLKDYTRQDITANVTFSDDFTKATIDKTNSCSGFRAIGIRSMLNSGSDKNIKSITHDYMTDYMGDVEVLASKTENESFDLAFKNTPVTVNAVIEANDLIEDAEDFYIFNFGKIIGQQSELYQEKERVTPVEINYPLDYFTTIEITVPDGYTVSGLEDCSIKNECKKGPEMLAGFESSATQEGDKITIKLHEFYKSTFYEKEKYSEYRAVINSAADFNKLVLIFEKE